MIDRIFYQSLEAFSVSTVINIPLISKELVISRISDISLPLSLINLLLTYATWFSFSIEETTLFKQLASTFEVLLVSYQHLEAR